MISYHAQINLSLLILKKDALVHLSGALNTVAVSLKKFTITSGFSDLVQDAASVIFLFQRMNQDPP